MREEEERLQAEGKRMESEVEGEERVIATAEQIVRRLGTTHNMTQDMLNILSTFDHRFSNITDRLEAHLEDRLHSAEQLLLRWDSSSSSSATAATTSSRHHHHQSPPPPSLSLPAMIWDGHPDQAQAYLEAVDEIQSLMKMKSPDNNETLERAQRLQQVAMARLLHEFRHQLLRHSQPLEPDRLLHSVSLAPSRISFRSRREDESPEMLVYEEEGAESEIQEDLDPSAVGFEDLNLVTPAAVAELRDIAKRLVAGNYGQECCQVYSSVRRAAVDDNLAKLGVEKMSIEEIQKTAWDSLEQKIKKWIQAIRVAVRVLFAREKNLCNQIFEGLNSSAEEVCFSETCKGPMMRLLNFGEAVAISRRSPEKLFRILDIYEMLSDLVPHINCIFCEEEFGDCIRVEAAGILVRLGEAAKCTFKEFANAIQRETSRRAIPGGAVHPLTRYVMNYIRFLFDYSDTLKLLIVGDKEEEEEQQNPNTPRKSVSLAEEYNINEHQAVNLSPLVQQLFTILELLKCNLDGKSKLYKDSALTYLFLMNNVHYIVQKVRGSELIVHLGDDWVRKHSGQVRQYATNYQRAAWNKVLTCLKDEGIHFVGSYSNSVSKGALKERFKRFNAVFEEVYRAQTQWTVPDPQLREELRISVTEKLLPAYRSFMGRFRIHLEGERHVERYLKYTPEDLENYLLDLFEGLPGSMNSQRTKSLP